MFFSKSFGYAVRSIVYIALMQDEVRYVQAEEVSLNLNVPRHFVGKILKRLAQADLLLSAKGPNGGFRLNADTLHTPLLRVYHLTDGPPPFPHCALRMEKCNAKNPCPVHGPVHELRTKLQRMLAETTVAGLLKKDKAETIRSISSEEFF